MPLKNAQLSGKQQAIARRAIHDAKTILAKVLKVLTGSCDLENLGNNGLDTLVEWYFGNGALFALERIKGRPCLDFDHVNDLHNAGVFERTVQYADYVLLRFENYIQGTVCWVENNLRPHTIGFCGDFFDKETKPKCMDLRDWFRWDYGCYPYQPVLTGPDAADGQLEIVALDRAGDVIHEMMHLDFVGQGREIDDLPSVLPPDEHFTSGSKYSCTAYGARNCFALAAQISANGLKNGTQQALKNADDYSCFAVNVVVGLRNGLPSPAPYELNLDRLDSDRRHGAGQSDVPKEKDAVSENRISSSLTQERKATLTRYIPEVDTVYTRNLFRELNGLRSVRRR